MRVDVESCRTHVLPVAACCCLSLLVAASKAAPAAGERQAKCFGKPHSQSCVAAISPRRTVLASTLPRFRRPKCYFTKSAQYVAQSSPRALAVDTA